MTVVEGSSPSWSRTWIFSSDSSSSSSSDGGSGGGEKGLSSVSFVMIEKMVKCYKTHRSALDFDLKCIRQLENPTSTASAEAAAAAAASDQPKST